MIPPIPYKGENPYIFVSYSHKDSAKVWPIIKQMQKDGYRIWYDEGIDPGTEWDENIAAHVTGCSYFIAFVSANYLKSDNCKDELNFARDLEKKQVLVYLEDVELPKGMALRFGRFQSFRADKRGFSKLYKAEGLEHFTDAEAAESKKRKNRKGLLFWVLPVVALLLLAFALISKKLDEEPPAEEFPMEEPTEEVVEEAEPFEFQKNTFLYDAAGIKLTAQELYFDEEGNLILKVTAENTGNEDRSLSITGVSVNGIGCDPGVFVNTFANSSEEAEICWRKDELVRKGLDSIASADEIRVIEGYYQIHMGENQPTRTGVFLYYPYGENYAEYFVYVPDEDDQMLADQDNYRLFLVDQFLDENGKWVGEFVARNLSDRHIQASVEFENLVGCEYAVHKVTYIYPGRDMKYRMILDEWEYEQQEEKDEIAGWTWVWDTRAREWTGPQIPISLKLLWEE